MRRPIKPSNRPVPTRTSTSSPSGSRRYRNPCGVPSRAIARPTITSSKRSRIVVVEQRERGFVEGAQVGIRERPVRDPPVAGLNLVQRSIRDRDELVLRPAVLREAGETGADRTRPGESPASSPAVASALRADDAAGSVRRPRARRCGRRPGRIVGEFVAAVSIEAVAVARRRWPWIARCPRASASPAGWPSASLKALEVVEVEHQDRERPRRSRPPRRDRAGTIRGCAGRSGHPARRGPGPPRVPRRSACAIEAWPAKSFVSSYSFRLKWASCSPIRPMFRVPIVSPLTISGTTIMASGSLGVPGIWIERGSAMRVVGQDRFAVIDDPTGDARSQRALVGEDLVREPVAGDDGAANPGRAIDAVDRERVVRDDGLERIGDEVQDARGIQRREQPLVDVEQSALAVQLVLQLDLLADAAARRSRRSRAPAPPRRRRSPASPHRPARSGRGRAPSRRSSPGRRHCWSMGTIRIDSGSSRGPDDQAARIPRGVAEPHWPAVLRHPARQALADGTRSVSSAGSVAPRNVPSNASGSHIPVSWSTR